MRNFAKCLSLLAIIMVLVADAHADFRLVGKIPAPKGCPPWVVNNRVTGLATRELDEGPASLFATTRCGNMEAASYLHLLRFSDGYAFFEENYTLQPPECGAQVPNLESGEHASGDVYVLADACGEITWIRWNSDTLYIIDSYHLMGVDLPTGVVLRNDTLFVADKESDVLHVIDVSGAILDTYFLPFAEGVEALAMYNGHLFIANNYDTTRIFEMTTTGVLVETHNVDNLDGCYPSSMAFFDDRLYVGCGLDSIFVFEFVRTYRTPIAPGAGVEVEAVPGELDITFDTVVDSGYVDAAVYSTQPCPPPPGVMFFSDYYEVTTTSSLEYISELAFTDSSLGDGTPTGLVRVFSRPSGGCGIWRDITIDSTEVVPMLKIVSRTRSEDDEFSVFVLGFDNRNQFNVVRFKFEDLEGHLASARDSIPVAAYNEMAALLGQSAGDFDAGHYGLSAMKADSIAEVARSYPDIPHTYFPEDPGRNVAGRIIGRAHTLAFSIRFYPRWLAGINASASRYEPLLAVGPNPTGRRVEIEFAPAGTGPVEIAVYSVKGERVRTLYRGWPGTLPVVLSWDGRNDGGVDVATGMYFVVAREGPSIATSKVVLQR